MAEISWADFEKVELRVGTITKVEDFPEARNPAYKIWVDLGPELGVKQSSARVTTLYTKEQLVGRQVICVANFAPKQVGKFRSEVLITGFGDYETGIILSSLERLAPNGSKLH
jgi:tRNA-binding protein